MVPGDRESVHGRTAELGLIAREVAACQLCPLANSRIRAVPGEGRPAARVMLVGEAPGREEDTSGRPFVGRAGKLLVSVLESLGTSRKDVFITNVVKCRPPKNRQPRASEKGACVKAHLSREIEVVEPRVVVLLGRTAAATLLGVDSLKEARGKPKHIDGTTYFCTYHPAAVLRNPRLKRTLIGDLRAALALGNKAS